ncbi:MAG: membrane protein insertase YidC [Candidatus Lambdaproteobacteria bacterium]|nr:membrane protein insertase YidC [Candidatus Lambdaproteobacteria bacterium]
MDKNLLLAIALSMLVIIGYYAFLPPQPPPKPKPGSEAGTTPQAQGGATAGGQPAALATGSAPGMLPDSRLKADGERFLVVETPRYMARIDRRGGTMESLQLKAYRMGKAHIDWGTLLPPLRSLISRKESYDITAPVEMISHRIPEAQMLGVTFVDNPARNQALATLDFRADRTRIALQGDEAAPATLTLEGTGPDNITVRKVLTFHADSYIIDYELQVINYAEDARHVRVEAGFGEGMPRALSKDFQGHYGPIYQTGGSLTTEDPDDIEGQLLVREVDWLGMTDNYFLTAVQPTTPISYGVYKSKLLSTPDQDEDWGSWYGVELPALELQPQKMISSQYRLFVGPKNVGEMRKFNDQLENSLDLTLDILARPLLAMLRWFYGYVGNYGIAIILLTVVVRVGLFPLTYKGMVAMKRMQKLQPKMVALREKLKNDKERLNREMMDMYKRYKVNPLGGCLPIALQIPIFFALYSALLGAIELRHSPFYLWIVDLSAKDPLYVTPILMGASMFLQQKLTPTTLDPTQAKIMMWMPLIFTAFMVNFPSGLVLYWLTSNILSVAQQLIINRINVPEPVEQTAA